MSLEESPENERLRRRQKIQIARAVADGHRARYVIPQSAGRKMRQPEARRRAQRDDKRVTAWLEHKRLEDERRRVDEWIQRENAADESVARVSASPTTFEALREEFNAALAAQARTTNELADALVRAIGAVARKAL
jgi:hypothetical protein